MEQMDGLKDMVRVIAFDADDTLWETQTYFDDAEEKLCSVLSDYGDSRYIKAELFKTETQNMAELGYGVMAFTLSMIETALRLSADRIPAERIAEIYDMGRTLLRIPATPFPGEDCRLAQVQDDSRDQRQYA